MNISKKSTISNQETEYNNVEKLVMRADLIPIQEKNCMMQKLMLQVDDL